MLNKPEALHYGQGEHPEPEITLHLGLCEGRRFYLHEGSFVKSYLVHMNSAQALCSRNHWQRTLLRYIKWHEWLPANLFGCCSYFKMKLNLGA